MTCTRLAIVLGVACVPLFGTGCTTSKEAQLEAVAKEWSMVIRASQVLPIYPLTEDIQPGDVFLVQMPIDQQHAIYQQRGFLPFDNHLWRLQPTGYKALYERSFEVGDPSATPPTTLPKRWMKPGTDKAIAWAEAPQAGFPTYSFSVKRGAGFAAALPVQGVPIGLSLLGTDTADGSVTIDKARTYGVDTVTLYEQVTEWAAQKEGFLAHFAPHDGKTNYLRVVTRVYLVGRLVVTLTDTSSRGAQASAGAPKAVDIFAAVPEGAPQDHPTITAERYKEGLKVLDATLAGALAEVNDQVLPGATLKVVAASSRSITTSETFIDRPLVIGYLGFDVAILAGGRLGPPIPTHAVLEHGAVPESVFSSIEEQLLVERGRIEQSGKEDAILTAAAVRLGGAFEVDFRDATSQGLRPRAAFAVATRTFLADETDHSGPKRRALLAALQAAAAG